MTESRGERLRSWGGRRRWPLGVSLLIAVSCFAQAPGRIVRDTKLDLVIDPVGFLSRTLHLWDPSMSFGQLQNQAAGYFFPMGPFFLVAHTLGIPPWIAQRLWFSALLVFALWGALKLAETLGVGRPWSRLAGATAYALAPSMLTLVGFQSGGQPPHTLLPWIVLPLVIGSQRGSPRRAAALSGLAVLAMGGVNGAATTAVLVLPALWLLTREAGPRRRALMGWWVVAVGLATFWWMGPLLLQGKYGLNFSAYTENASITTATASVVEALRGTSNWVGYLVVAGRPWLQGGWSLVTVPAVIVASTLISALGLGGLARKDMPERTPFVLSLGIGVLVITAGYAGPIGGPASDVVRSLLDGPLVAFRNLHKFSPIVALPIGLGVAHSGARLGAWVTDRWSARRATPVPRVLRVIGVGVISAAVVLSAFPLVSARLPTLGSFEDVPDHWREAADWLSTRTDGRRSLVLPAAAFGEYEWGRSFNEPMQPLSEDPWAVRDLIPLGSLGATRLMDGVEDLLARGDRSPALADYLARAGVRYVVVRNDLDIRRLTAPRPQIVRSVLAGMPGLERVARFGDPVEPLAVTTRLIPSLTTSVLDPPRAVEIYQVDPPAELAVTYPTEGIQVVSGGPEELLELGEAGQLDGRAVVLSGEADVPLDDDDRWVVTDGLRRRDVNFGRVHSAASYALTPDEDAPNTGDPPRDRLPIAGDEHLATARNDGVAEINASSYAQGVPRFPESQPFAAFDQDAATAWRPSSSRPAVGQWIEVRFDEPVDLSQISVAAPPPRVGRARVSTVRLTTENGTTTGRLTSSGGADGLAVAAGETDFLRLTILRARGGTNAVEGPGISEIAIPGVEIGRPIVTPADRPSELGRGSPEPLVLLSRLTADPFDLIRADEDAELHRVVDLPDGGEYELTGTAVPLPGPGLDQRVTALLPDDGTLEVGATSTYAGLPVFSPRRMADGDPATTWVSDPSNPVPSVTMRWDEPRTLSEVTITDAGPPTERPTRLSIDSPAGERDVDIPQDGAAEFDPLQTSEITITFPSDVDPTANPTRAIGIAELTFDGLDGLEAPDVDPTAAYSVPCGGGPTVVVDGEPIETTLRGTIGDLLSARPLTMTGCGDPIQLDGGAETIDGEPNQFAMQNLVLQPTEEPAAPGPARTVDVRSWGDVQRKVEVGAGDESLLAVTENFNPGWQATLDGEALDAVRVDGWRQAFVVPEGEGGLVTLTFAPDRLYRAALLLGVVFLGLLAALALVPARRPSTAPALAGRRWPSIIGLLVAAVVCFAVAGPLVLVVPLLLLLPDREDTLPFLAAVSFVLAGILVALTTGPGGNAFGPATQILATQALAAVLVSLSPDRRRRRAERRARSTGRTEAEPDDSADAPPASPPPASG